MDGENNFERHVPVHPLPDEIQKMGKDDTVCQFCGVSYLIHREIKKLEDRIKDLEANLEEYESLKTKETQFRQLSGEQYLKIQDLDEKLSTRIQMISSLNNDIENRDVEISRLKKIVNDHDSTNNKYIEDKEKLKKKLLVYESVVMETKMGISEQKSELMKLELMARDQKIMMTQYIGHIKNQIEKFSVKNERSTQNQSEEINLLKIEINNLIKEKAGQEEQIDFFTKQNESFQNIKRELNSQIAILNDELAKTKNFNNKYYEMDKENRSNLQKISDLKNEIQDFKFKLSESISETAEFKQKLESFHNNLNQTKSAYELELKLKNDAVFKAKNELDSIKKRYEEKDKFEKEILNNHQINLHEVTNLKYEIKNLNERIADFQNEKNQMTLAHQCQITQLKDTYKEKLQNAELSPEKLTEELNKEREKFRLEMQKKESEMNQNFKMEFDIQEQKYNEMYAKYQQISKDFEGNSKTRINDLEFEIQKFKNEMKHLHEDKTKTEKKLKDELNSLREITKELHQRLEKYTDDDDQDNKDNMKKELNKKSVIIRDLELRVKELESQVEIAKEETKLLQETVHNECLERHELHEKLEEARDELLELKKNAYSSQQLIPLKASINKNNLSQYKNGTGLIDVNNPPENYPKSYPKTLNEMNNSQMSESNQSTQRSTNRRNSASNPSSSEKSSAENSAKIVHNPIDRHKVIAAMSNKYPTEPVQLFKKLNELSHNNTQNNTNNTQSKKGTSINNDSLTQNKKRISLLLARK